METTLQPMSIGEILDRTFSLYRKNFVVFSGIAAVPYLILLLLELAIMGLKPNPIMSAVLQLILLVVLVVASVVVQAASTFAVSDIHLGCPTSISSAYGRVKGNLFKILLAMILIGVGCIFGCIFCLVPGVILGLAWSAAIPTILIESKGPIESMKRSWTLTKGSWFRIFIMLLLLIVISYIVYIIVYLPFFAATGISIFKANQNIYDPAIPVWINVLLQIEAFIGNCLVAPISTIAIVLIYYDQRVRKEGFDFQLMISSLTSKQNEDISPTVP
jgi:hypothetical protein